MFKILRIKLRKKSLSIKIKFILSISMFLIVAILISTTIFIQKTEQILTEALKDKAFLLIKNFSIMTQNALLENRYSDLQSLVEDIASRDRELRLLLIVSDADTILASSDPDRYPIFTPLKKRFHRFRRKHHAMIMKGDGLEGFRRIYDDESGNRRYIGYIYLFLEKRTLERSIRQFRIYSIILTLVLLIAAVISAYFLGKRMTGPIGILARDVRRIAKGDLDISIRPVGRDEIGSLMRDVERMRISIREAFKFIGDQNEQIKTYSEGLEKLVRERTKELQAALDDLRQKDDIMQNELNLAAQIQRGILPKDEATWDAIRYAARVCPMETVSGDFFEVNKTSDSLNIILADVSGHGVPAALVTMAFKQAIRAIQMYKYKPKDFFSIVNMEINKVITTTDYLTAFNIFFINSQDFLYSSAGHQPGYILRFQGGSLEQISTNGVFLGAFGQEANRLYEEKKGKLYSGDKIVIFTDGIIEQQNPDGERYGSARLEQILQENYLLSPRELIDRVFSSLDRFRSDAPISDDISMVIIELASEYEQSVEYARLGMQLLKEEKYEEALEIGQKLSCLVTYLPENYYINAVALYHLGQYAESLPYFSKYLAKFFNQMPTVGYMYFQALVRCNLVDHALEFGQKIFYEDMPDPFYAQLLVLAKEAGDHNLVDMILTSRSHYSSSGIEGT